MQTIHTYAAAVTSYVVAVVSIFYTGVIENYSTIAAILGFILLVARLIQEVPRAWEVLTKKKKKTDDD